MYLGLYFCYIKFLFVWFFTSQSTILQLCRDRSSWVEPVLSKDKCVLLKDTTQWRQVRKEVVYELEFGAVAVMQTWTIWSIVTDILILIGSLRFLKRQRQWTWYLENVNFKRVFLIFSYICWRYTLELPLRGNSNVSLQQMRQFQGVPTSYVFSIMSCLP